MPSDPTVPSVADRRAAVEAAREALTGLATVLWQAQGDELGQVFQQVDDLSRAVEAARVAVLAEAVDRGETSTGAASIASAGVGWVGEHAPSLAVGGGAARLFRVVTDTTTADTKPFRAALVNGRVGVANAVVFLNEMARLHPHLQPAAVPAVWDAYLTLAMFAGPREIRGLRSRLIDKYGQPTELQQLQDRAKGLIRLSQPYDDGAGAFDYHLVVDVEGKNVLEAALGPLSAPRPVDGPQARVGDLRGSDRRRGDALVELVRRAVAAADGIPTTTKAQLFVTIDIDRLTEQVRAGTVLAGPGTGSGAGDVLAASTVRRMACDATILPVVLGAQGQVLDLGFGRRCFTAGQTKALWLRDGGCSMPGCTIPATWCDGHHLVHWADGGPTNLDNAALLCGHHHTLVHARGLTGRIDLSTGHVVWDLTRGSYTNAQTRPRPRPDRVEERARARTTPTTPPHPPDRT